MSSNYCFLCLTHLYGLSSRLFKLESERSESLILDKVYYYSIELIFYCYNVEKVVFFSEDIL